MSDFLTGMTDDLRSVLNPLAKLLNVEFAVFDDDLNVVCSTISNGHYVEGRKVRGHFLSQVIGQNIVAVNTNPGAHERCAECRLRGRCPEKADMSCSIDIGPLNLGAIGITAFDENQRETFKQNQELFSFMLKGLRDLIRAKALQQQLGQINELLRVQTEEICKMVNDSVIILDSKGEVTTFNPPAEAAFKISRKRIINKPLDLFFPDNPLSALLKGHLLGNADRKRRLFIVNGRVMGAVEVINSKLDPDRPKPATTRFGKKFTFSDILGNSYSMMKVKEVARKIAKGKSTVLICGETGTGKELFANAIHSESAEGVRPFRTINCAAIPQELLESELYGYERGAFTGAGKNGKPGKFELANGGTLFLDEIGDIQLHLQAKLLRAIETRTIERVGGNDIIPIDVRLIAATNKDLEEMVKAKQFRQDLFYRINVIHLHLPALRERPEDILLLADKFLARYCSIFVKNINRFSKEVRDALLRHSWPGNVRELENCVEHAVNFETTEEVQLSSIPENIAFEDFSNAPASMPSLREIERAHIEQALRVHGRDYKGKMKAARSLGIDLTTLYRKMKLWKEIN